MKFRKLFDFPARVTRWAVRFRHRRGYGVHSPYAFGLITDVIYGSGAYYAYEPLAALRSPRLRAKDLRLVFRLADFSRARRAVVLAPCDAALEAYLRAGRRSAQWLFTDAAAAAAAVEEAGFIYADTRLEGWAAAAEAALSQAREGALLVVRGVADSARSREAWRQLCARRRAGIALDLHDFGLFCLERRLSRQDYVVDYF